MGWGVGGGKKKVTDQRVQGLVKKIKKSFNQSNAFCVTQNRRRNVLCICGLLRRKEGGRRSGRPSPDYDVLMWDVWR